MSILEGRSTKSTAQSKSNDPMHRASREEERRAIDDECEKLLRQVPELPYILTIPKNDFPLSSGERYAQKQEEKRFIAEYHPLWRPDELHLQYISFIYREPGDSLLVVRTEVDEERDRRKKLGMASMPGTPVLKTGTAKKKISLSAYKNKVASGGQPQLKSPFDLDTPKQTPSNANGMRPDGKGSAKEVDVVRKSSAKMDLDAMRRDEKRMKRKSPDTPREEQSTRPKRVRTPPPPEKLLRVRSPPRSSDSKSNRHGLPPLLSPITSNPYELPPLLSPTLPAVIEAALERRLKQSSQTESNTPTSSGRASPQREQPKAKLHGEKIEKSASKDAAKQASSDIEPETPEKKKRLIFKYRGSLEFHVDVNLIFKGRPRKYVVHKAVASKTVPSFLNKDKPRSQDRPSPRDQDVKTFGKGDRSREDKLNAIKDGQPLKTKPTPSKIPPTKETLKRPHPSDSTTKPKHSKPAMDSSTPDLGSRESDGPNKRPRMSNSSETEQNQPAPITPRAHIADSRRSQDLITPRKQTQNSTGRTASNDSALSTPKHLTPLPPTKAGDSAKAPRSTPTAAQVKESDELALHSSKWNSFGRILKHAAQAIHTSPSSNGRTDTPVIIADVDKKRKAILSLETIMAYMLAYSFSDDRSSRMGRQSEYRQTWTTLLPLVRHNGQATHEFTELDGLRAYLEYVIYNRLTFPLADKIRRLSSSTATAPSTEDLQTTSSTFVGHLSSLKACYADAARKLTLAKLMADFPKTCALGTASVPDGTVTREDMLQSKGLDGAFYLPIGVDTTPAQAVRFAIAMLEEWIERDVADGGNLELRILKGPEEGA